MLEGVARRRRPARSSAPPNPLEAAPGSIRGDLALEVTFNLVHGSDSDESAEREIALWFPELGLILASASPRRREILGGASGVSLRTVPSAPEVERACTVPG